MKLRLAAVNLGKQKHECDDVDDGNWRCSSTCPLNRSYKNIIEIMIFHCSIF